MTGGGIDRRGPKDSENAHNSFLTKFIEKGFWRFATDINSLESSNHVAELKYIELENLNHLNDILLKLRVVLRISWIATKKIINLMKYFLSVLYRTMSETSVETEDGREDIAIINENDTKQLARPIWKTSYQQNHDFLFKEEKNEVLSIKSFK